MNLMFSFLVCCSFLQREDLAGESGVNATKLPGFLLGNSILCLGVFWGTFTWEIMSWMVSSSLQSVCNWCDKKWILWDSHSLGFLLTDIALWIFKKIFLTLFKTTEENQVRRISKHILKRSNFTKLLNAMCKYLCRYKHVHAHRENLCMKFLK